MGGGTDGREYEQSADGGGESAGTLAGSTAANPETTENARSRPGEDRRTAGPWPALAPFSTTRHMRHGFSPEKADDTASVQDESAARVAIMLVHAAL